MNEIYSHPENAVRHSYPLATHARGVGGALSLCVQTMPIILLRLGILVAFTVASVIWFAFVMGISAVLARGFGGSFGIFAFILAIGLPLGTFAWFKRYVLYVLEMAHIAVLTRLITHGDLGSPSSQMAYGKEMVQSHFGEVNLLLVLDGLVQGVVNAFTRTLDWITSFLPLPEIQGPMTMVKRILDNATEYVGDTIFSYNLARSDENKWRSSKDGLIYYAQNWKPILKTAVWALIVEYAVTAVVFVVLLLPAFALGALLPHVGGWGMLLAFVLALNIKSALVRPMCLTMVMLTFHEAVQNQEINLSWDEKLSGAATQFQQLAQRAKEWVAPQAPTTVPVTPPPLLAPGEPS